VEGEVLMETAPEKKMTKEINKNDEKMDEIGENGEMTKGDDDARMMEDKDREIVFEKDRAGTTTTGAGTDTSDNSSDSSDSPSLTGTLGSSNDSNASNEVVVTKVIQGKAFEKNPDFSNSDEDDEGIVTVKDTSKGEDNGFISVKRKTLKQKQQ
jgi:hypothetical protein